MDKKIESHTFTLLDIIITIFLVLFMILSSNINSAIVIFAAIIVLFVRQHFVVKPDTISTILFVYVLINGFSIVYAENVFLAIKETMTWTIFFLTVVIFKKFSIIETGKYKCLLIGGFILNIILLSDVLIGFSVGIRIPTFNCLATINCMLIILIENLLQFGTIKRGLLCRALQCIFFFGIIVSAVRGIMVILIVYYVYIFAYKQNRTRRISRKKKFLNSFGIVTIGILVLFLLKTYWVDYINQISNIFNGEVYSNRVRILLYKQSFLYTVQNNLVFGVGAGNFTEVYHLFHIPGFTSNHAHNIFLQPFIELGLIGAVTIIILFAVLIRKSLYLIKKYRLMYLEIIVSYLIYGMVDYVWVDLRVGLLFFIFVGQMIYSLENKKRSKDVI